MVISSVFFHDFSKESAVVDKTVFDLSASGMVVSNVALFPLKRKILGHQFHCSA